MTSNSAFAFGQAAPKVNISDTLIAPTHFFGWSNENAEEFFEHFSRYAQFKQLFDQQAVQLLGIVRLSKAYDQKLKQLMKVFWILFRESNKLHTSYRSR
jgi:hypothetical protein